jgi:hypothetical protein
MAVQRQPTHAGKECADAERRLRQKMRIYPDQPVSSDSDAEDQEQLNADLRLPVGGRAAEELRDPEADAARKPIVSVHGRDLTIDADDDECGHLIQLR